MRKGYPSLLQKEGQLIVTGGTRTPKICRLATRDAIAPKTTPMRNGVVMTRRIFRIPKRKRYSIKRVRRLRLLILKLRLWVRIVEIDMSLIRDKKGTTSYPMLANKSELGVIT